MNVLTHMAAGSVPGVALLQLDGGSHTTLLLVFVGVIAFGALLQSLVIIGIVIAGLKAQQEAKKYVAQIEGKVMPLITQSHALVTDLTPQIKSVAAKLESISHNLSDIAAVANSKVHEFAPTLSAANETVLEANETVREANRKAVAQVARINGMVSTALDATAQLGATVHHGIRVPVREVAGVVSGVKAAIDTFVGGAKAFGAGARTSRTVVQRPGEKPLPPLAAKKSDLGL